MKLGAEPKKTALLAGLLLVAGYFVYSNLAPPSGPSESPARRAGIRGPNPDLAALDEVKTPAAPAARSRRIDQEFRLSFKSKGVDPSTIDPKLRLDLLAKVRSVDVGPAVRNLFTYGAAPASSLPASARDLKPIIPKPVKSAAGPNETEVAAGGTPPPPITLKYYGYTAPRPDGRKRAFFSEGDCTGSAPTAQCDIFIAAEGDLIMKRYKVLHIGVSTVEVEDTQFNHKQPLPIAQESPG